MIPFIIKNDNKKMYILYFSNKVSFSGKMNSIGAVLHESSGAMPPPQKSLNDLPHELIFMIAKYIGNDQKTVVRTMSRVSRKMYRAIKDNNVQRHFCINRKCRYCKPCEQSILQKAKHHNYMIDISSFHDSRIMKIISAILEFPTMYHLHIKNEQYYSINWIYYIVDMLNRNDILIELSLQGSILDTECMKIFSRTNSKISTLNLSCTELNDDCIKYLSIFLKKNRTIKTLLLNGNSITCKGVKYLLNSITDNHVIENIELYDNRIGDEGAEYVRQMLTRNASSGIKEIDIARNRISVDKKQELIEIAREKKILLYSN
jgi:hypothetical protein